MNVEDRVFPDYAVRIRGVEALLAVIERRGDEGTLAAAAKATSEAAAKCEAMPAGWAYLRLSELLSMLAGLHRWQNAVREAEPDADRHLRAVHLRADEFVHAIADEAGAAGLAAVARSIGSVSSPSDFSQVASKLLGVALPIPLSVRESYGGRAQTARGSDAGQRPPVAIVAFKLDGRPLMDPQTTAPNLLHDLEVEVELSRWPTGAQMLVIEPLSVEPPDVYTLPRFEFSTPSGRPPHRLVGNGRLHLRAAQAIAARPLEFQYRAYFEPPGEEVRLELAGHKLLRLQSYDPARTPITGYQYADAALLAVRDVVRTYPGIPDSELSHFLQVMTVLGRTAGEALQDAVFSGRWEEAEFQREIRARLRGDPVIGADLSEHPSAGGGITDLAYHRIPIELKSEPDRTLSVDEAADRFGGQTAQYTVANDRRLGILCVLDCAPKHGPPGPVGNDIALRPIEPPEKGRASVLLGIVIIRGNLARPSALSRRNRRSRKPRAGPAGDVSDKV